MMGPTSVTALLAVVMFAMERSFPGRSWPSPRGWWVRALAVSAVQVGIVFLAGATWDHWLVLHRPWSADSLGLAGGALSGYLVITFIYYWWHRARHHNDFLWRWLHQFHHSATRIEIITSFYKHPFELVANGLLSSAIVYGLIGLNVRQAILTVTLTGVVELFYHWNVRTPRWLGYLVQRPESHLVHHQEGLHAFNYSDLPLWDMLFGTYRNPKEWNERCGLGREEELRLGALLAGRDVTLS
jgi:sterol desaturase/sphingolipid hydroxylase (fatty acid hydroxylase superfamily)